MQRLLAAIVFFCISAPGWAAQPTVRVEPSQLQGPRELKDETAQAVVRDYVESWQSLRAALAQNRADLLDPDFVGSAADVLTDTIHQQRADGIHTKYIDRSHDIRIVLYTPEGLSVQLIDNAVYDQKVFSGSQMLISQTVHARYIVVLTPAERRWRVRILQATPK